MLQKNNGRTTQITNTYKVDGLHGKCVNPSCLVLNIKSYDCHSKSGLDVLASTTHMQTQLS